MSIHEWLPYIVSIVTGIAGFFVGNREREAKIQATELQNEATSNAEWIKLYSEMKERVAALEATVKELQQELFIERTKRLKIENELKQ